MKKLLALVLCVMMFVSVLSTNAFADKPRTPAHPDRDTGTLADVPGTAANNKAVKNAKENIEYMYGALAADNAVFGAIQSMDSVISNLAKELFKDFDSYTTAAGIVLPGSKLESNTKTVLRDYIGSSIVNYMNDHSSKFMTESDSFRVILADGSNGKLTFTGKYTTNFNCPIYVDADGSIYALDTATGLWYRGTGANSGTGAANVTEAQHDDVSGINWGAALPAGTVTLRTEYKYNPIAYANTFAAAVNDALTNKDGASLLESMAYQIYSVKVLDAMEDEFEDLYDAIHDWEDGDAILSQYHFHDTEPNGWFDTGLVFNPYAMMNVNDYPNSISLDDAILAP